MAVRGIRGAISVENNSREAIGDATRELIGVIMEKNHLETEEIAGVFFSVTTDLDAAFPAFFARQMGWELVPMMCTFEMDVPGSQRGLLRVMVLVNTDKSPQEIHHVYLKRAALLRPDWAQKKS